MTAAAPLAQPYTCVYTVEKVCYECGAQWTGNSFVQHPADAPPLPGVCGGCIDKSEARLAAAAQRQHAAAAAAPTDDEIVPPRYTNDR